MIKQLLVKGQEMDLLGNTYAMEWVSPLFQSLSSIKENRSTTIQLAKTNHNLGVLGNINVINVESTMPYSYIDAEYRINGVPIISNAKMYILSVGRDSIDVCLTWNFNGIFIEALKRKLNDITNIAGIKYDNSIVPGLLPNNMGGLPVVQPDPLNYQKHNLFIKEHALINFIFDYEFKLYFFDYQQQSDIGNLIELPTRKSIGSETTIYGYFNRKSNKPYEQNIRATRISVTGNERFAVVNNIDRLLLPLQGGRYTFNIQLSNDLDIANIDRVVLIKWYRPEKGDEYYRTFSYGKNLTFNELLDAEGTTGNYGNYEIAIWFDYTYTPLSSSCTVTITQDDQVLRPGDTYPITINLPDITVSELLKDYFVRENKFIYMDKALDSTGRSFDIPKIWSFSDVFTSKVIDWSDKLLEVESASFKPEDLAQKSIYKYKDNEEVTYKSDGAILVNNETLAKEEVIYESKFSPAPQDDNGTVIIPHFDEKGEYFDSKHYYLVNTRVVPLSGIPNGRLSASFTQGSKPLNFDAVLSRNYIDYVEMFNRYKEITIKAHLNVVDIMNIDLKKRYFFSQFSSNFLIKKCNIVDEIATLTMIKL